MARGAGWVIPGTEQPEVPVNSERSMPRAGRRPAKGHSSDAAQDSQSHPHDLGQLGVLQYEGATHRHSEKGPSLN